MPGEMSDAEITKVLRSHRGLSGHLTTFLEDHEEVIGALVRQGMTRDGAAHLIILNWINLGLDELIGVLTEDPS